MHILSLLTQAGPSERNFSGVTLSQTALILALSSSTFLGRGLRYTFPEKIHNLFFLPFGTAVTLSHFCVCENNGENLLTF